MDTLYAVCYFNLSSVCLLLCSAASLRCQPIISLKALFGILMRFSNPSSILPETAMTPSSFQVWCGCAHCQWGLCAYVHVTCDGVVLNKAMTVLKKRILHVEDDILFITIIIIATKKWFISLTWCAGKQTSLSQVNHCSTVHIQCKLIKGGQLALLYRHIMWLFCYCLLKCARVCMHVI